MITKSSSVANILDNIISKIEIELEEENISNANHSKFEDTSNLKNKLLHDSVGKEDINCRICYDFNQEFPIIYPCKCKVRNNT